MNEYKVKLNFSHFYSTVTSDVEGGGKKARININEYPSVCFFFFFFATIFRFLTRVERESCCSSRNRECVLPLGTI